MDKQYALTAQSMHTIAVANEGLKDKRRLKEVLSLIFDHAQKGDTSIFVYSAGMTDLVHQSLVERGFTITPKNAAGNYLVSW